MKLPSLYHKALQHFDASDPVIAALLRHGGTGPTTIIFPTARPKQEYFERLTHAIIGQQISTKAATAIKAKVHTLLPSITPAAVLDTDPDLLRSCGLSPQKLGYITKNATLWDSVPINDLAELSDEAVIEALTKLYGIGRWSAEMFCIFTLARPDVYSFGDLGLTQSLNHYYRYKPHYVRKIEATVLNFRPYRSVAALALWHARDTSFELP